MLPQGKPQLGGFHNLGQWLRLCAPNSGGPGLIPGQEGRPHVPPLRPSAAKSIDALTVKFFVLALRTNGKGPVGNVGLGKANKLEKACQLPQFTEVGVSDLPGPLGSTAGLEVADFISG